MVVFDLAMLILISLGSFSHMTVTKDLHVSLLISQGRISREHDFQLCHENYKDYYLALAIQAGLACGHQLEYPFGRMSLVQ